MSIRVMTMVWDSGAYEGGTLLVLLAMADHADDIGGSIYPTIRNLARKSRLSPRQVHNCITTLKADEMIAPDPDAQRTRSGAVSYRINIKKLRQMVAAADDLEGMQSLQTPEAHFRGGMKPTSGGGMQFIADNNRPSKPSVNHHGPADAGQPPVSGKDEKARRTVIGDFQPGQDEREAAKAYWQARGRHDLVAALDDQISRFMAHHRSVGSRMADWSAAWQTWYSRALGDRPSNLQLAVVPRAAADTATWVRRLGYFHLGSEDDDIDKGCWHSSFGPPPGQPDCRVPKEALAAYAAQQAPRKASGGG